MHEFGLGAEKNDDKALQYYVKASDRGDADASYRLGELWEKGVDGRKDSVKAIKYYK